MSLPVAVPNWLRYHSMTTPNRPALLARGQSLSWVELEREVDKTASCLTQLGVRPGDHVGVLLGNSPGFVTIVHALMRAGAVLVPLNTRLSAEELGWQAQDAGLSLLVHDEANASKALEAVRAGSITLQAVQDLTAGHVTRVAERSAHQLNLSALHSIVYTSGTTGRPKGAMLTYGNHWWSATASAINLGHHRDERWLVCLPLFHVGGLAILFRSVIFGVPVILHDGFDPAAVNSAIDEQGVTLLSVVSTMLGRMLEERCEKPYPPNLRAVLLGGGPAPRPLLDECIRRGLPVLQTYGMTETASQAVTLSPEDASRKAGSAGKPLIGVELRIERDGEDAAPGEEGEITLRGPSVSTGYWQRPEKTEHAWRGGWFHTGDIGCLDEEGYLYVLDRRDDLVISGGENVYPAQVEAVLLSHSAVAEAGVTGRPDPRWGQAVVASVVLRPGARTSEEELRAYCREQLAGYKVPASVVFVTELPRNAAGKLLRRMLRERWTSQQGAEP